MAFLRYCTPVSTPAPATLAGSSKLLPSSSPWHNLRNNRLVLGTSIPNCLRLRGGRAHGIFHVHVVEPKSRLRAKAVSDKDADDISSQTNELVPKKSVSVILLAGGKGKRMGASMPKQYLPLLGQPIALYSFRIFSLMSEVKEIVVVCDPSYRDIFEEAQNSVTVYLKFASPGKERQDSVFNGLQEVDQTTELVCVHDSARPLVLTNDVKKVLNDAWVHGAAVLGVPVKATIKEASNDNFVTRTLNRQTLWEMHTPQVIKPSLLRKGFEVVYRKCVICKSDVFPNDMGLDNSDELELANLNLNELVQDSVAFDDGDPLDGLYSTPSNAQTAVVIEEEDRRESSGSDIDFDDSEME